MPKTNSKYITSCLNSAINKRNLAAQLVSYTPTNVTSQKNF